MTTVPPPTAPPAPPAPVPASAPVATVPAPPPPLLAMPPGARLEAVVQSADLALGKVLVQTALGSFDLKAPLPLPADARLVLQVALQAPVVQLLILSINGQPLAGIPRPGAAPLPGPGSSSPGRAAAVFSASPIPDRVQVGTVVEATLLRSTPQSPPRTPGSPAAPASSPARPDFPLQWTLAARVAQLGAAVGGRFAALPEKVSAALSSLISPRADREAASSQSPRPPAGSATTPPGTAVAMRVTAMRADSPLASSVPTGTAPLAPGRSLAATVVSSTPGNTIVETAAGPMLLATAEALPKGLRLTLELAGPPRLPLAETEGRASPLVARGWPALEDAATLLKRDAPELHRALIGTQLARPDSTLAAGIVMFLAALKAGDLVAWLGEDMVRALTRSRPDLLRRLNEDFRELARAADDPGAGDWRVAVIPFNAQTAIEQLRILTRRRSRQDPDAPSDSARFVVDVTLSRLGRIQIDGLVRRKEKRLDLVVRTAEPLPAVMREDIRRLFTAATGATGIGGLVAFDARTNGFVEVQAEYLLRGSGDVIA
ncbi:MAG: hypothetical protein IT564_00770 [Rhodospirillales bacterium]|nr:hypothetical protein [Rhodospirillales bacterium]